MRKTYSLSLLTLLTLSCLLMGCPKKVPSVSERIAKVWIANRVDENSTTVYTKGGTSNIRDYSKFKLDLSKAPTVTYTILNTTDVFTGQYSVPDDQTLVLTNLNPAPTGTNGTITFTINSIDDGNLKITAKEVSQKTGGTTNVYTLVTQ